MANASLPVYSFVKLSESARFNKTPEERMREAGLEPQEPYPGYHEPWNCICKNGHRVSPQLANISQGRGCNKCAPNSKKEGIEEWQFMEKSGFEPQEPLKSVDAPWKSKCKTCNNIVSPRYDNIKRRGGGCKYCAIHGFDFARPAVVYLITNPTLNSHKIGIAGKHTDRLNLWKRNDWEQIKVMDVATGLEAWNIEKELLIWFKAKGLHPILTKIMMGNVKSGYTETVPSNAISLKEIWDEVEKIARWRI